MKKLTPAEQIVGEDAEETALLREMLQDATDYLWAFRWCPPIDRIYLGYGVGGAVAVFLFHFGERIQGTDEWLWVVTGDLRTACFVIDQVPDPASALEVYCQLMEDWAKAVLEGRSYELEPCKGQVRFFRTFFRPNSASFSPRPLRPRMGGRGEKEASTSLTASGPAAWRPTSCAGCGPIRRSSAAGSSSRGTRRWTDIETNLASIRACGYEIVGHFTQPESAWWRAYYQPLEERLGRLRRQHAADEEKLSMIEGIQQEIDLYRQYAASYGNVFFVMRRR